MDATSDSTDQGAADVASRGACPTCGVAVLPGYPRCPKCHAIIPSKLRSAARPTGPHSFKATMYAGGTSVASTSRYRLWIGLGLLAVAAGVALAIAVRGGGRDAAPLPVVEDDGSDSDDVSGTARPSSSRAVMPSSLPAARPASTGAEEAARELGLLLRNGRMWSTVTVDQSDPGMIIIRSSLCADEGLQQTVDGAMNELRAKGVTGVQCTAPHGSVVFERAL